MLLARHARQLSTRSVPDVRHLIVSIRVRRPVESQHSPKKLLLSFRSFSSNTTTTMASDLTAKLAALSIKPTATVTHAETTSPATWKEAVVASGSAPASFELVKTLVYKPKTAKSATPVPVVVIAREETETNSSAIGKALNLKELRLASEDLLTEFFSLDKNSCASICPFTTFQISYSGQYPPSPSPNPHSQKS
jgi:hypothetical protein